MIELNKIYHWDCLDLMKQIPDKSIDLVLTDPPYWIWYGKMLKWKWDWMGGADKNWWKDYWCPDRDESRPSKEYFDEIFRISKNQIIRWGNYFIDYLEPKMCRLVRDKWQRDFSLADWELARTSFDKALRICTVPRAEALQDWKQHPTQKSLRLFKWCLENYSEPWMTILDPFLWSWTTAIACKQMWRNFIWIEKEQKYVDIANKRLKYTQVALF